MLQHFFFFCLLPLGIVLTIGNTIQGDCDISTCHPVEGICSERKCMCIEPNIAQGHFCKQPVNLCTASNLNRCENNGICRQYFGYYHCECTHGYYYGQFCEYVIPWENPEQTAPSGLHVHIDRRIIVGTEVPILITLRELGDMKDRYVTLISTYMRIRRVHIDTLNFFPSDIKMNQSTQSMPYEHGYICTVMTTFWQLGMQKLFVILGSELVDDFDYSINFLVLDPATANRGTLDAPPIPRGADQRLNCIPVLQIMQCHASSMEIYIDFDIFRDIKLIANVTKRCYEKSAFRYQWKLYEPNEYNELRDFGINSPILYIPALSIATKYTSGYIIEVILSERKIGGAISLATKAHCGLHQKFMKIRGVRIKIRSTLTFENQKLTLNADRSRDYNIPIGRNQRLSYFWSCHSDHDPNNERCCGFSEYDASIDILRTGFKRNTVYTFRLEIVSSQNHTAKANELRRVYISPEARIFEINEHIESENYGVMAHIVDYTPPDENIVILSAAWSRDYNLQPNVNQHLKYYWFCSSESDPNNTNCQNFESTDKIVNIYRKGLKMDTIYKFNLIVESTIYRSANDNTSIEIYARDEDLVEVKELTDTFCVRAIINVHRLPKDVLLLDASKSRNYKFSPKVNQHLIFYWSCYKEKTCLSTICDCWNSSRSNLTVTPKNLHIVGKYLFTVKVTSSLNDKCTHTASKLIIREKSNNLSVSQNPLNFGVKAIIRCDISPKMDRLVLNATRSRFYNFATEEDQHLNFSWSCSSFNDAYSPFCRDFKSTDSSVIITPEGLKVLRIYKINLQVTSATDKMLTDNDSLRLTVQNKQFTVYRDKPHLLAANRLNGPPEDDLEALDKVYIEDVEESYNYTGVIIFVVLAVAAISIIIIIFFFLV